MQKNHPFVNRKKEIDLFKQLIDFDSKTPPFLNYYGISGIGKTFLVRHLIGNYAKDIPFIELSFEPGVSDYDYNSLINKIIRKIQLKLSDKNHFRQFKEKRDEILKDYKLQLENKIEARDGSKIEIEKVNQTMNVTAEAIAKLQIQTRNQITEKFFDALANASQIPIILIFDAIENLVPPTITQKETPDYASWLMARFLPQLCDYMPRLRIVLSGRKKITFDSLRCKSTAKELDHLPPNEVDKYLKALGIKDDKLIKAIIDLTDGYSLSVAMTGDLWNESLSGNKAGLPPCLTAKDLQTEEFQTAYRNQMVPELLLKRIRDRAEEKYKKLIDKAGLFRKFTYEILRDSLLPDLDKETFDRFIRYSFVSKTSSSYQYHPQLRKLVMERHFEQDSKEFRQNYEAIYEYLVEQGDDERFFAGINADIEGVFDEWINYCHHYYNTWQTDSMKELVEMIDEITHPVTKEEQGNIYFVKARYWERFYQWDQALEYYLRSETIKKEVGDKAGLGTTYNNIGGIYDKKGDWDKALDYYLKSEGIRKEVGDKAGLGTTYNNIGGIYFNKGDWDQALEYYLKSETILKEVGDKAGLGTTYNNIGNIYQYKGDWDQALEYYLKSEKILKAVGDKAGLGTTYNNIGLIYSKKGDWDQALEYYLKSETIQKDVGDKAGLGRTYNNIGFIYDNKGDWHQALEYYLKSETITKEVGDKAGLGTTYNNIGNIYQYKGDWDQALEYYLRSETIFKEVGDKAGLAPTYNNIGLIYSKKGDWDQALEYYLKSETIRKEVGDKAGLGYTYLNIAAVYYQLNDKRAMEYIDKSVAIFRQVGARHELGIALQWQEGIYKKFGVQK